MSDFYVYAWQHPCGTPFYIGKGKGKRSHSMAGRNVIFKGIVSRMLCAGGEPVIVLAHEGLTEEQAFYLERSEINKYGRIIDGTGSLSNMTDGGEGISGHSHSEDTKEKMRVSSRGKKHSEETRAKLAHIARNISEETRAKLAAAGRAISEENREKLRSSQTGKVLSTEVRAKMSLAMTGRTHSDETRAKLSLAHSGKVIGDEHRSKLSRSRRLRAPHGAYKGVSFRKGYGTWEARIFISGRNIHLGTHKSPEDAARAYDAAAIEHWGMGNCYLNFPTTT